MFNHQGVINPNLMAYANPFGAMLGMPGQGESPPSSSFAANGLPFAGLDYLRNFNPGTYDEPQENLWQGFDGNDFRYEPDLPFTFGDMHHSEASHHQ